MLGHILGGLADPVLHACLRQGELHVGRPEQRALGIALALCGGFLEGEQRLGVDDAVIIFHLVAELQPAAWLRFRLLGEFDRRRAVGNGVECVDEVLFAQPVDLRRAAFGNDEATLVGSGRGLRTLVLGDRGHAAGGCDVELDLPARPDHEHAAGRHRHGSN
jgi:hypothetical protein